MIKLEKSIKFSPMKIKIRTSCLFLFLFIFWLLGLRFWNSFPWFGKIFLILLIIGTPCCFFRIIYKMNETQRQIFSILPELEEGTLFSSEVDYIDEELKMIIYDHYLISYAEINCIDIDDIKQVIIPTLHRPRSNTNLQGFLKSEEYFAIYTPIYFVSNPKTRLHKLANYLNANFDIPVVVKE